MSDSPSDCDSRLATVETRVSMLDRLMVERWEAFNKALEIQAAEYARRLEELNHAHQQALQDRASFLPRDVCALKHQELDAWKAKVSDELAETRGKAFGWTMVMGVVATAVAVILRLVK